MASYEAKISGYTVTINYQQGGTNQIGVKKPAKVKSWAICPVTEKRIEGASNSMGESTRMVEKLVAECVQTALEAKEAEAAPAGGK
ncbi:MAG: hypothetical protein ACRYFS_11670 [Janthinobacterium lividum]